MRGHIEGTEIYLSEDQLPAFTFSINTLSDPSKTNGSRSTTLRIVSTPESKRILGNEFMAGVPSSARPNLRLIEGGTEVFNATVLPVVHNRNEIECVAVGSNAKWFEYAQSVKLKEFAWGLNPVPTTYDNIIASWTDSEGLLPFTLVDYGYIEDRALTFDFPRWIMRPAVRISKAIDIVMRAAGFQIYPMGSLAANWSKFAVLTPGGITTEHFHGGDDTAYAFLSFAGTPYTLTDVGTPTSGLSLYSDPLGDPGGNFVLNRYVAPFTGTMDVRYDNVGFGINVGSPPTIGEIFYLQFWNETTGVPVSTLEFTYNGESTIRWWGLLEGIAMTAGDEFYFSCHRDPGGYAGTCTNVGAGDVTFYPIGQIKPRKYTEWGTYVSGSVTGEFAGVVSSSPIRIGSAMPDMTAAQLLQGIAQSQKLVFVSEGDVIQVWHEHEYMRKPSATVHRDWSDRADHTEAPAKVFSSYPKRIDFGWQEDAGDRDWVSLNANTALPGYSNEVAMVDGAYGNPIKIELPWAVTVMGESLKQLPGDPEIMIPHMRKLDGTYQADDWGRTPRLLIIDGVSPGVWDMDSITQSDYPNVYFVKDTDGIPLPWANAPLAQYPLSVEANWGYYLDTIRNGRTLEISLFIRDHELLNFDHGMPTLVDDGGGPAWYYVQEIRNHRFGKNVPTRCTLVPLPNMEVSFDAIPTAPFVVPANPFVCAGPGYGSFTLTGGTSLGTVKTSTGYASTRSGSGDIVLHGGGNPDSFFDVNVGAEGSYCLWASNGLKEKIGTLTHIDNENSYVTALDINGYAGLLSIDFEDNVSFSALIFSGNPLLEFVQLSDYDGSILDFSDNSNLGQLQCVASVSLSTVILAALNPASFIDLSGCALTAATVNAILANAVANGMTGGTIDLSGGTSAAPTGQGILDKAYLLATTPPNTVTTN